MPTAHPRTPAPTPVYCTGTGGPMPPWMLAGLAAGMTSTPCLAMPSSDGLPAHPGGRTPMRQRPSLVIAMGTISYLLESAAAITLRADCSETSCSAERPPNSIPMRSFFVIQRTGSRLADPADTAPPPLNCPTKSSPAPHDIHAQ